MSLSAPLRRFFLCLLLAGPLSAGDAVPVPAPGHMPRTPDEAARIGAILDAPADFGTLQPFEDRPGGAATGRDRNAMTQPMPGLEEDARMAFALGSALFDKLWVAAPSSTRASDGLGPVYNSRSCQGCHPGNLRGRAEARPGRAAPSLILRLGQAGHGASAYGAGADPVYGRQIQDTALPGLPPEGQVTLDWRESPVTLADGTVVMLRQPVPDIAQAGYGPLAPDTRLSLRIAPALVGLGLIEAVPVEDILAGADPEDADGDGISGRANVIVADGHARLGRFSHKAGVPDVAMMTGSAFSTDIGIGNPAFPDPAGDCTQAQTACRAAPHGDIPDAPEIGAEAMAQVVRYLETLAVPPRRDPGSAEVLRGKALFHAAGCPACHRPAFVTARLSGGGPASFQLIWPYSDFLIHDMGDGLSDEVGEGLATGREWRTAPLWGLGLTATGTGHSLLHDGRARSVLEAILWHGGEAAHAREKVSQLRAADRDALLRFVESL